MSATLDSVDGKIDGVAQLLQMFREDQSSQFTRLRGQIDLMNGRQRENTQGISANREAIGNLRIHVDFVKEDVAADTTRKAVFVGIVGFVEAVAAFIASVLARS